MNKITNLAKRKYFNSIGSKTLILSLLITPIFIGVMILINSQISKITAHADPLYQPSLHSIQFIDFTEQLTPKITTLIEQHNQNNPDNQILFQALPADQNLDNVIHNATDQVFNNQLDAYFIIDAGILDGSGQIRAYSQGNNIGDTRFF
ncbi:MAG: hypothetical protein GY869_10245, partial [Planctomycetes bacterium]|nr:hypothetical protein [Planctomycetota bacterium]